MSQARFQKLMADEFQQRNDRNPRYSLRSFARDLDLDPSTLSQILNGKRNVSFDLASRLCIKIDLPDEIKNPLLLSLGDPKQFVDVDPDSFVLLSKADLDFLSDWEAYAVLCALELPQVDHHGPGIAKYIGADIGRTQKILDYFCEKGIVEQTDAGYVPTGVHVISESHGSNTSEGLDRSLNQWIEKSQMALRSIPAEKCHFYGTIQAIPSSKLPEVKRRIKEFHRSLGAYLGNSEEPNDAIYRLNVQLFPVGGASDDALE